MFFQQSGIASQLNVLDSKNFEEFYKEAVIEYYFRVDDFVI